MAKMIVEVWDDPYWGCIHAFEAHTRQMRIDNNEISPESVLLYVIEGDDWSDCMRQHHERQGWEPYVPMED